jgi:hypothetical protein
VWFTTFLVDCCVVYYSPSRSPCGLLLSYKVALWFTTLLEGRLV